MSARLGRAFFERHTVDVARDLLGCYLVRREADGSLTRGRIVETEAYRGDDAASHAHGIWKRKEIPSGRAALLFDRPGLSYVYLNYGVHWLFNVVTEGHGEAGAVLLRALEPVEGLSHMKLRRPACKKDDLICSGPGNLARALNIGSEFNGVDLLTSEELYFEKGPRRPTFSITEGPRIGITKAAELPWRFTITGHPAVSAKSKK